VKSLGIDVRRTNKVTKIKAIISAGLGVFKT
jgi:hypothetical protein